MKCTIVSAACEGPHPQKDKNFDFSQQNLRQLRLDLQKLGAGLQSGERACCRNTGGERLRQALTAADEMLAKQVRPQMV